MIRKEDGAFLGWCGLKYSPASNEHDVGFRFFKKYWNMGFATEAAKASVDAGFEKFGIQSIIGRAMAANMASVRVLEKIGMAFHSNFDFCGNPGVIYKLDFNKYTKM